MTQNTVDAGHENIQAAYEIRQISNSVYLHTLPFS